MRVAHFSVFAPNQCGLYHTAKELVLAEQAVGIDAGFIAYDKKEVCVDGDFKTKPIEWADDADVLVRHSAIPDKYHNSGKPIVLALHGRPESSAMLEKNKTTEVIQMLVNKQADCRYKAYVTFWEEYVDIWKNIVKRPLFYAPATVDMNEYSPENTPAKLKGGEYNILICDMWREDVRPFNLLFAAQKFAEKHKNVKINLVALSQEYHKSMAPFLVNMKEQGILGHVSGQIREINGMYTACDMVLSSHVIATRSIREALASGCKLVAGQGCKYTPYTANPMDIDGYADAIERCYLGDMDSVQIAKDNFSLEATGNAMKKVFESVLPKKTHRKVFLDIGGHLGETVRRFFREKDDAQEYEIYSFEPDAETFKKLDERIGHIKNVNLVNACMSDADGIKDFYIGRHNDNEGGTLLRGKFTGGVDYQKPEKVESVNLVRWLKSNINEGDEVVLKMNIEGGEYDLMELLLDNDLTGLFSRIYIQLHSHKFRHGDDRFRFNAIEERFYKESKCRKLYMANKGAYPFNAK